MKKNLILINHKTEPVQGTMSSYDNRTFFGSKMIDVEDEIFIDNSLIQYSEVFDVFNSNNNGFQYYDDINKIEKKFLIQLDELKKENQQIQLKTQTDKVLKVNANWLITIYWKKILKEYLFYRLKEARTFKCIKNSDVMNKKIDNYIYDYIENNLLSVYTFDRIDFYIQYFDLNQSDEFIETELIYKNKYDFNVKREINHIVNIKYTVIEKYETLEVNYQQISPSETSNFRYYFDLYIKRI